MDCLLSAFIGHCEYLGIAPKASTWILYRIMKVATHGATPQYTYGGVAPWMIHRMAAHNELRVHIAAYQYMGVDELLDISKRYYPQYHWLHKLVIKPEYMGMSFQSMYSRYRTPKDYKIAVAVLESLKMPGIWLHAGRQHASFELYRPAGLVYGYYSLGDRL